MVNRIVDIHRDSDGTYSQLRLPPALARQDVRVNHKPVEGLMREHGIAGFLGRRQHLIKRDQSAPRILNLVGPDFDPERLDEVWCGDLTWIPTGEGG